ncbi:MAG: sulfur carrier protein ThiS [Anaerohalosphaeraceae bacterium]|nr:sulfur carrier protein ThiS [Anaerohalosphaeraceae bacterium]
MAVLKINGQAMDFADDLPGNLAGLLEHLKVDEATVVAEIDGDIISRSDFVETVLADGQKIELIKLVGGG